MDRRRFLLTLAASGVAAAAKAAFPLDQVPASTTQSRWFVAEKNRFRDGVIRTAKRTEWWANQYRRTFPDSFTEDGFRRFVDFLEKHMYVETPRREEP